MKLNGARWLILLDAVALVALLIVIGRSDRAAPRQFPSSANTICADSSTLDGVESRAPAITDAPVASTTIPIAELPRVDEPDDASQVVPADLSPNIVPETNDGPFVTAIAPLPATTDEPCAESEPRIQDQSASALTPDQAAAYAVAPKRALDFEAEAAPLAGHTQPTPELVAIARQADSHIARGLLLAERGAVYSARAEFIQALRLSAAALDAQRNTTAHNDALARGLRALEETKELTSSAAMVDDEPPGHALQRCLAYAQEQLAAGSGDLQPAASALFALGKLEMTAALSRIGSPEASRAAVYLQAALVVNPRHALAANELGVLLARHGRIDEAKAAFQYSARIAPEPAVWRNLAIIHHGLGELELAASADRQYQKATSAAQPGSNTARPNVLWVDPAKFAASGNFNRQAPAVAAAVSAGAPPSTAAYRNDGNSKSAAAQSPTSSAKR